MPPKKDSNGEGRDSSPTATYVKVSGGTPGGEVSHQEVDAILINMSRNTQDQFRRTQASLDQLAETNRANDQACTDQLAATSEKVDQLVESIDKLIELLEARKQDTVVPTTPG